MSAMVTETLRKKGSPLVDVNQHGWQIQSEPASWTTPNDISGKPNAPDRTEMMELQCSTTNFPAMTHSSGEPNSKTQ